MTYETNAVFDHFRRRIAKNPQKHALLQLTGRLESHFVQEFLSTVFEFHEGDFLPLTNVGLRGERKIDIAVLRGQLNGTCEVAALYEAKYFRNWHRAWPYDAKDEISGAMKSLLDQIQFPKGKTDQGGWPLASSDLDSPVYGLAFASFVSADPGDPKKTPFLERILRRPSESLVALDHGNPRLDPVYEDAPCRVLGAELYCSFHIGCWKTK